MGDPLISYVLVTRNKLPYLKVVLESYLKVRQPNEEIIVADGASNDGTLEYLRELKNRGEIDQLLEGPDSGQAHATNRAMLAASGVFIKFLLDDDIFDYDYIRKCAGFMLENPGVDAMGSNMGEHWIPVMSEEPKTIYNWANDYIKWRETGEPFWFSDLVVLIRKSSIPLCGLWNVGSYAIDVDYGMRMTSSGKVNLAWCEGMMAVRVVNPSSLSLRGGFLPNVVREVNNIYDFYGLPPLFDEAEVVGNDQSARNAALVEEECVTRFLNDYSSYAGWLKDFNSKVSEPISQDLGLPLKRTEKSFGSPVSITKHSLQQKVEELESRLKVTENERDLIVNDLEALHKSRGWRAVSLVRRVAACFNKK